MLLFQLFSHVWLFATSQTAATRLPCPSLCPGVCLNLCLLNLWCHPTISFSANPYSSFPQSFPASGPSSMSWLFASAGQSIGASSSASILPMNIQGWLPLGLTGLISLLSKGLSRVFSSTIVQKHQFFSNQSSLWSNTYIHTWLLEKAWLWLYGPLSAKWCLCFLIHCLGLLLARFVARFVGLLFFQGASIFSFQQENVGTHQKEIPHAQGKGETIARW